MICDNCKRDSKVFGGRFKLKGSKWVCAPRCDSLAGTRDTAKSNFQFESMNIGSDPNAGPVRVQSLRHLRQLEKEHGVVSVAGNFDSKNWDRS